LAFLLRAVVGVWLYALLVGCTAAPDPTAFANATRSLETSVREVGVEARQRLSASDAPSSSAAEFGHHWAARDRAMRAASDYSQSLVKTFSEAHAVQPTELSKHLQALAHALGVGGTIGNVTTGGVGMGMGAGVGVGVLAATADTIAFLHAQIALVQAARTFEEALTRAQPVIDRIAELIVADTADLEQIVRASAALQRLALAEEFNEPLAFAESIDRRRSEIRRLSYGELRPSDLEELQGIEGLKASVASDLALFFARRTSINQRESDALRAIQSTRSAIQAWAEAHRNLARSMHERQPADITQLTEAIAQLQTLIVQLRKL